MTRPLSATGWHYVRGPAIPGRRVLMLRRGEYSASVERGLDTGWWYWHVSRGDLEWCGQAYTRREAIRDAEEEVW